MTRKDYVILAEVIRKEAITWNPDGVGASAVSSLAYALADKLAQDNPRFDRERFLEACMPR